MSRWGWNHRGRGRGPRRSPGRGLEPGRRRGGLWTHHRRGGGRPALTILVGTMAACGRRSRMLNFQRLDVYERGIAFLALVGDITGDIPKGHAERVDQLVRSAESVVRNIAEGAGRWSEADSAKHYKIARGEAMECAASLDVMKLRKLITDVRYERVIHLLQGVVVMLTKMLCESTRGRPSSRCRR